MIRVSDLIQLKVGDVIQLDKQVSEPLKAFVGETPKYYVQPGLTKGKLAVQIINLVEEGVNMDE